MKTREGDGEEILRGAEWRAEGSSVGRIGEDGSRVGSRGEQCGADWRRWEQSGDWGATIEIHILTEILKRSFGNLARKFWRLKGKAMGEARDPRNKRIYVGKEERKEEEKEQEEEEEEKEEQEEEEEEEEKALEGESEEGKELKDFVPPGLVPPFPPVP